MLVCVSDNDKCVCGTMVSVYVSVNVCTCVILLTLFQVEFRVFVYPTSRQSRWCPEGYPTSHSLRVWHWWRVSQEMQKFQTQSGSVWSCGPSEGTLPRVSSTTSEGLCQGTPGTLSCRHLARPPHCRHRHPLMFLHLRGHSKYLVDGLIHPDEERLPDYPPGDRGHRLCLLRIDKVRVKENTHIVVS